MKISNSSILNIKKSWILGLLYIANSNWILYFINRLGFNHHNQHIRCLEIFLTKCMKTNNGETKNMEKLFLMHMDRETLVISKLNSYTKEDT